ncbi:MAG: 5'-methylthioadenosine/adenosylhomocysteine nucleosidase [Clostridia bacterium]|nr:5'-methylthioadenosine/adenosylhomocysteine nucleosidase [Clostridia bacterium]
MKQSLRPQKSFSPLTDGAAKAKKPLVYGVIGAMAEEVAALKCAVENKVVVTVSGMEFVQGKMGGANVVIVQCGIGKVNAATCAQLIIDRFGADVVINTGVAGSLDNRINIGDIVVSTDAVEHDFDVTALNYAPGEIPGMNSVFAADENMIARALEAVKESAPDIAAFTGRVCSGDRFIASKDERNRIIRLFGGTCCEMEGAAIAHVCSLNQTPFVVIRAISDKADDSEEVSYVEFEHAAAERCANIVRYMLAH